MKLDEIKKIATEVIKKGWDSGKDEDDIKMDMFTAKVPFGKLNSLFKSISVELGYMADPKEVTEGIKEVLKSFGDKIELNEWSDVEATITHIVGQVEGATPQRALTLLKAHCRDLEIDIPRKPGGGGATGPRAGKLANAIVNLVNSNPKATKQEAFDILYPIVTGEMHYRNTLYYINTIFVHCMATKNGVELATMVAQMAEQTDPADPGVAEPADGNIDEDEELEEAMA